MRCKNPFWSCLWSSCSQVNKRRSTSLDVNSYGTQCSCFCIISITLRRLEIACWVSPNDSANSSCVWHESSASNASNSESSKIFCFPPLQDGRHKLPDCVEIGSGVYIQTRKRRADYWPNVCHAPSCLNDRQLARCLVGDTYVPRTTCTGGMTSCLEYTVNA